MAAIRKPRSKQYLSQSAYGGLRDAQAHLNKMLGEQDRGRNLDSPSWMRFELCRLRASISNTDGRL
jgi:hypothetical protein